MNAAGLTVAEVMAVLAQLQELHKDVFLVGGQSIAYWADKYRARWPCEFAPVNGADIDFCSEPDAVIACAVKLQGVATLAPPLGATPNTCLDTGNHVTCAPRMRAYHITRHRNLARTRDALYLHLNRRLQANLQGNMKNVWQAGMAIFWQRMSKESSIRLTALG